MAFISTSKRRDIGGLTAGGRAARKKDKDHARGSIIRFPPKTDMSWVMPEAHRCDNGFRFLDRSTSPSAVLTLAIAGRANRLKAQVSTLSRVSIARSWKPSDALLPMTWEQMSLRI